VLKTEDRNEQSNKGSPVQTVLKVKRYQERTRSDIQANEAFPFTQRLQIPNQVSTGCLVSTFGNGITISIVGIFSAVSFFDSFFVALSVVRSLQGPRGQEGFSVLCFIVSQLLSNNQNPTTPNPDSKSQLMSKSSRHYFFFFFSFLSFGESGALSTFGTTIATLKGSASPRTSPSMLIKVL